MHVRLLKLDCQDTFNVVLAGMVGERLFAVRKFHARLAIW